MARRAKNEGTIRKRPDGRFEARVVLGHDPGTGKPIRKSVYGKTQKEVRKRMEQMKAALASGTYSEPTHLPLKQWLDTWLTTYCRNVKPATYQKYEQDIRNHIAPALGAVKLDMLTPLQVQKFINSLQDREKPLSSKTVKNIHSVLHSSLDKAVELDLIFRNPADRCTLPRIERKEPTAFDIEQIKAFLAVLDDSTMSIALKVDLFTGLREGELLGLRWSCVDFENGSILVDKQLTEPRGGVRVLASLKNDKPRTLVPAPYVMELLRSHRQRQLTQRMRLGPLWDDGGFPDLVFTDETGKFIHYQRLLRYYQRMAKQAGIDSTCLHHLRHTFATNSLFAGDDLRTVQENLGHATAAFTLQMYSHVTPSMREASAQRMQKLIDTL